MILIISEMNIICPVKVYAKCLIYKPSKYLDESETYQDIFSQRECVGTLIMHLKKYYVLTCFHMIKSRHDNDIQISVKINDQDTPSHEMIIFYSIEPYDFTILAFKDSCELDKIIDKITTNKYIFNTDINDISSEKFSLYGKSSKKKYPYYKFIGYGLHRLKSEMYPKIPLIEIKTYNKSKGQEIYKGLTGSLVGHTNKIYGMITYIDKSNNIMHAIPSYCLILFFNMGIKGDEIKTICLSSKICSFGAKEEKTGHIVAKGYGITYVTKIKDKTKEIMFRKDDIIESIDNINFNENGEIYMKEIGMYVPIDTYMTLTNNEKYQINYYTKRKGDHVQVKDRYFMPVPISKHLRFHLGYYKNVYKYKGLIITEMSEELLDYYNKQGIKLEYIEDFYTECFTKKQEKLIVVIGVDYNDISSSIGEVYKGIGLPLVPFSDDKVTKYYIALITRMNSYKLNNLSELEQMISKCSTEMIAENKLDDINDKHDMGIILRLSFNYKNFIRLKFHNNMVMIL